MRLVAQRTPTSCGQAVVAMVAGVSYERALKAIGHEDVTTPEQITGALLYLGVKLGRSSVSRPPVKGTWVAWMLKGDDGRGHVVLVRSGKVLDSGRAHPVPLRAYTAEMAANGLYWVCWTEVPRCP